MSFRRLAPPLLFAGALLLAGCSRKTTGPLTEPHALSGHVVLRGFLVDSLGVFAGTRVVGDADGVRVDLRYGSRIVDSTYTVDGVYRFPSVAPGSYVAETHAIPGVGDETLPLTIARTDVSANDTLHVTALGDIFPVPNPLADFNDYYFTVPDTEAVEVRVLDVGGRLVRTLFDGTIEPGRRVLHWTCVDQLGQPVPPGLYWVTFRADVDVRAQLLFRGE